MKLLFHPATDTGRGLFTEALKQSNAISLCAHLLISSRTHQHVSPEHHLCVARCNAHAKETTSWGSTAWGSIPRGNCPAFVTRVFKGERRAVQHHGFTMCEGSSSRNLCWVPRRQSSGALPAKAKVGGRQLCFRGHSRASHCRGKQAMGLQVLHQVLGAALQPAPGCHMVGV